MMPEGFWPDELSVKQVEAERLRRDKRNMRNAIIEECAQIADAFAKENKPSTYISVAIRALKDKP